VILEAAFLVLAAVGLTLVEVFDLDEDTGPGPGEEPYPSQDRWTKWHFMASAAITVVACLIFGIPDWRAVIYAVVIGLVFEYIQGYVHKGDLVADVLGAGLGGLICYLL
jgi:VanZ family protein